jgi:hypothetical protein
VERNLEILKPEDPKSRSAKNESFENPKIAESNESSENLFESKCLLFLFVLSYKYYGLFQRSNGLTNFEFNCTEHVQSSTEVRTPVKQCRVWSGGRCRLPPKQKMNGKERMSIWEWKDQTPMGMENKRIRKDT